MFSPDLEERLEQAFAITQDGKTVLLLFDDMIEVAEHFQAVLDWYKAKGVKIDRRWGSGVKLSTGWIYFVGADTHCKIDDDGNEVPIETRGVSKEIDLRPWAGELVRKTGLEARLRDKGLA